MTEDRRMCTYVGAPPGGMRVVQKRISFRTGETQQDLRPGARSVARGFVLGSNDNNSRRDDRRDRSPCRQVYNGRNSRGLGVRYSASTPPPYTNRKISPKKSIFFFCVCVFRSRKTILEVRRVARLGFFSYCGPDHHWLLGTRIFRRKCLGVNRFWKCSTPDYWLSRLSNDAQDYPTIIVNIKTIV